MKSERGGRVTSASDSNMCETLTRPKGFHRGMQFEGTTVSLRNLHLGKRTVGERLMICELAVDSRYGQKASKRGLQRGQIFIVVQSVFDATLRAPVHLPRLAALRQAWCIRTRLPYYERARFVCEPSHEPATVCVGMASWDGFLGWLSGMNRHLVTLAAASCIMLPSIALGSARPIVSARRRHH